MSIVPGTAPPLSAQQISDYAYAAGFKGEGLKVAVAVALGESGGNAGIVGDAGIQDAIYGPSIGLWQIRSLKAEKGKSTTRDELALYDPGFNARSAYSISGGGTNFAPWTVFKNGTYKKFLDKAGIVANTTMSQGGSAGSSTTYQGDINYPVPPPSPLPVEPLIPKDPANIRIRGGNLNELVGDRATSGSVNFSADQMSQISVVFADPEQTIWRAPWLGFGTEVEWENWPLDLAGLSGGYKSGLWHTTMRFWPRGGVLLKLTKGQSRSNVTPGEWIGGECAARNIQYTNYEANGILQTTITPTGVDDGGGLVLSSSTTKPEKAWDTMTRLARENGCWLFMTPEGIYFGKPTVFARALSFVDCGFQGSANGDRTLDFVDFDCDVNPPLQTSSMAATGRIGSLERSATVHLPRWRGERVRPGMGFNFPGMAKFDDETYIASNVSWDLSDLNSDVSIAVEIPINPEVQAANNSLGEPTSTGELGQMAGGLNKGSKQANDFVAFAQAQVGDQYVYGAAPSSENADPNQFDCSGLIRWAAGQVGISMPRTSDAQYGACLPISVEDAMKIRGALVFIKGAGTSGHVAICLGNGTATVEARGAKYGVVNHVVAGRGFNAGGLIKGMNYGFGLNDPAQFLKNLVRGSSSSSGGPGGGGGGGGVGAG